MKPTAATLLALLAIMGCGKPAPIIVVDGWWNVDYAKGVCRSAKKWNEDNNEYVLKFGCQAVNSCPEISKIWQPCLTDEAGGVRDYQTRLVSELAALPECGGVTIVTAENPNKKDANVSEAMGNDKHWTLMIDYLPGHDEQGWTMTRKGMLLKGEGTLTDVARRICAIATARGATTLN